MYVVVLNSDVSHVMPPDAMSRTALNESWMVCVHPCPGVVGASPKMNSYTWSPTVAAPLKKSSMNEAPHSSSVWGIHLASVVGGSVLASVVNVCDCRPYRNPCR